jgi:quercetin dioxygenase-like cupin family protein
MRHRLASIAAHEVVPGFRGRFVHSDGMTLAYWDVAAGASIPTHSHVHEQVVNVLEGELELIVDGTEMVLVPGDVVAIPGHTPHSARGLTDARVLDVFSPVRDDYRFDG